MTNSEIPSFMSEDNSFLEDFNKSFSFVLSNEKSLLDFNDNSSNDQNSTNKISIDKYKNFNQNYLNNEEIKINNHSNTLFQQNCINYIPNNLDKTNLLSYNPNFQNNQFNTFNNSFTKDISSNFPLYNQINPIIHQQDLNNFLVLQKINNNLMLPFFQKNNNLFFNTNYKITFSKKNNKNKKNKKSPKKNEDIKSSIKKENIINIELIEFGKEKRTIVRLLPIPNKYSPFDIIRIIDKYLKTIPGKRIYSSIYVPLSKTIGKNIGYCFVELVSPKYVIDFYNAFNGLNIKKCKIPCSVVFSDKQNFNFLGGNPLREPIVFKDTIDKEK